jgi:hypothetical protein
VGTAFPIGRFLWLLWHPWRWSHFGTELTGMGHYSPDWDRSSPYLVLHANANLIPDHNDIYNRNFVKFLTGYLNLYLEEKPDETPVPPQ